MAKRPILKKKANRIRKAFRTTPTAYVDLVSYLKDRRLASTTGEAEAIILAGRVRSDSHKLGIGEGRKPKDHARIKLALGRALKEDDFETVPVVDRYVLKARAENIQVLPS